MMYYHIIYNSSQRTQEGTVGLGIRSYTEGTPKEYIEALKENGFFSYSSGNMPQPSPKELLENGETILRLPVTYNYAKLFVPGSGKELYVVARTVSVGFDYPYYVKFTAARMDNFVVDAYLFETCPDESVLQVFYEKPQNGNIGFVPRNWVPTPDNEERRINTALRRRKIMIVIRTIEQLRTVILEAKQQRQTIGLVPTMGYLHEGHLTLASQARKENEVVVMSIFVNPTQFGPNEDFESYPRDLARDTELAESVGVDYIFAPSVEEMYPHDGGIRIRAGRQATLLCGASRPGHFDGVLQVVTKL